MARLDLWKHLAHNQCNACEYEWTDRPGSEMTKHSCPNCGHVYWTWINYDDWRT